MWQAPPPCVTGADGAFELPVEALATFQFALEGSPLAPAPGNSWDWHVCDVEPGPYRLEIRDPHSVEWTQESVLVGSIMRASLVGNAALRVRVFEPVPTPLNVAPNAIAAAPLETRRGERNALELTPPLHAQTVRVVDSTGAPVANTFVAWNSAPRTVHDSLGTKKSPSFVSVNSTRA